ncbi:MAG: yocK [Firmicutes bacterium]|nr:yocK [Bacillota bacterium]
MQAELQARFKQKLLEEKERLSGEIAHLENGILDTMAYSVGELSVYDNHPADLGSEMFERSKDTALKDNALGLLGEVEAALTRLENNTYGTCETCRQPIAMERLEALPWAKLCIDCQRQDKPIDDMPRPIEEESLEPPFKRTFLDDSDSEFVGFDGEDALQDVLKYGSSDSPQDLPGSEDYDHLFPNSHEHEGIVDIAAAIPAVWQQYSARKVKRESPE